MPSWVVVLVALFAAACGGGSSPSSPSGSGSVGIQGVVLGGGVASSGELTASSGVKASGGSITVTVEGTGLTTTVSANGTFELKGAPSGTFTLVFTKDGVTIGRVEITATDGSEVKITVQIQSTTLVVIEIKVENGTGAAPSTTTPSSCIISGGKVGSGIELEGNVAAGSSVQFQMTINGERSTGPVEVTTSASTAFKCNGGVKLTDTACKAAVTAPAKVHVSGRLDSCAVDGARVSASQVMVQK